MNLFEGNSTNKASVDRYWGSNSNYIFLRNIMLCPDGYDNEYTCKPADIEKNNPYMSYIGNILHHENSTVNRIVWFILSEPDDFSDTNLTLNTLIRHGNYDNVSENVFWDPEITNHNIPNSYYLNSKPDFFTNAPLGNASWPIIGPDLSHNGIIPAQQRFCNLNGITPPQVPSSLSAQVTANSIRLTWSDNSDNEQGFRIEQSNDGTNFRQIEVAMKDSTSYTLIGLAPYSNYYFRVCSYLDVSGNSSYSNIVSTTTQEEIPDEFAAWYKFDGNAADSSGNDYHGTVNGPTLTPGKEGQAYLFDGVDDEINVSGWNNNSLHGDDQAFTIAAWIYPHSVLVNNWVVNDDSPWANFNFGLVKDILAIEWDRSGNIRYSLRSIEYPTIKANAFSHIAVTYDPINRIVRLFLNGQQVVVDRIKRPTGPWLFDRLYIGRGTDDGQMKSFDGIIDDVRIYKSCLSGNDISKIYYGGMVSVVTTLLKPEKLFVSLNYPNPFNSGTMIQYNIPENSRVVITVYDILGRKVRTLRDERQRADWYSVNWDGRNTHGTVVSSGLYIICLKGDYFQKSQKVLLLK
jgi:hypothetical protein